MKTFRDFIIDLVKQRGIVEDPEIMEQIYQDVEELLEAKINAKIIGLLPENKIDQFMELMDGDDDQKMHNFVKEIIPNIDVLIAEELIVFKAMYLAN